MSKANRLSNTKEQIRTILPFVGLLIIITILGFWIRVSNLNNLPVFADEAIYIRWAQIIKSEETLRFIPLSDGKQPLYMWITAFSLKIFEDPLFASRMVSVFVGSLSIILIFIATHLLFSSSVVALIAALIYSVLPFAIFFERLAMADALLSFLGLIVFNLGILVWKFKRFDLAMLLGFGLGAALITKSPAIYFAIMLPLVAVLGFGQKKYLSSVFKYTICLVPAYLIGLVIYNVLRLGPNFHMIAIRNLDYVYPLSHILTSPLDPFMPFIDRIRQYFQIMGTTSLMVLFLLSIFALRLKFWRERLFLLFWFILPILVSAQFSKTMTARYVFFSVPYYVILASSSFILYSSKYLKYLVLAVFFAFMITAANLSFEYVNRPHLSNLPRSERSGFLEEWTAGHGISEFANYIKSRENKRVVIGTEGYFGTLPDGLQMYFDKDVNVTVIGVGLELDKIPTQLIGARDAGDDVYLVLNDERANTDFEPLGLKKIFTFPKEIRPDGTRQSLVVYELLKDESVGK